MASAKIWEVLNGVGVDGVGGNFPFFRFSSLFLSLFLSDSTRANNCNLLEKWGFSLRPRLHQPHVKLPEKWRPHRNRCPYRRCGVNTEIPYRLPF